MTELFPKLMIREPEMMWNHSVTSFREIKEFKVRNTYIFGLDKVLTKNRANLVGCRVRTESGLRC